MVCQHFGIASSTEFIILLPEIKMAAAKPEVVVSRPTCHLEMKFQRLYLCSHDRPTLRNTFQHGIHYPSTRNQDGGCKTGSSYKSAYMPPRNRISMAICICAPMNDKNNASASNSTYKYKQNLQIKAIK